jgi:predicted nucleic acid-binding protein
MSAEPGIVDANVLVYAFNADAPQHLVSRRLLDEARAGATILYVTSQILCEFYAVVTNPRRVTSPRSSMLANGIQRIYTFNTADFESFIELVTSEP